MMKWPRVMGEHETIDAMRAGLSVARFGDGELKCMEGKGYVSQDPNKRLAQELHRILTKPNSHCLPAIPTLDPKSPKYSFWPKLIPRFLKFLDINRVYGSAFISRHDVSPWIDNVEYANSLLRLWRGWKTVVVASNMDKARQFLPWDEFIDCPLVNAYGAIDELQERITRLNPEVVVMTAGPTATCLANRLAGEGIQAFDLGRAGRILEKFAAC